MEPHWSVVQLAVAFLFIFTAFFSQSAIEETVINNHVESQGDGSGFWALEKHDGYVG